MAKKIEKTPAKQVKKRAKRKPKVVDVSKLKKPNEITIEIEIEGRTFLSVLKVKKDTTPFEIELAKANLRVLLEKQFAEAKRKRSKWLRLRRWCLDLFKKSDATKRAEHLVAMNEGE